MVVPTLPYSDSGNTIASTTEGTDALACNLSESHFEYSGKHQLFDSRGVWYHIDGGLGPCFNASTDGTSFNATLAVYEGACNGLSCVADGKHRVTWRSGGSQTNYKVLVVGGEGQFGQFKLNITVSTVLTFSWSHECFNLMNCQPRMPILPFEMTALLEKAAN